MRTVFRVDDPRYDGDMFDADRQRGRADAAEARATAAEAKAEAAARAAADARHAREDWQRGYTASTSAPVTSRFDASGGYRADRAPQDGRPVFATGRRADAQAFLRAQPSGAVAQAADRARRYAQFDAAERDNSMSGEAAREAYIRRRADAA